jgi:hypothetical protein
VGIRKAWLEAFVFTSWPRFHGKNKMPCPILFLYFFVLFIGATMNQHPQAHHPLDATFIGWGTYVTISTLVF